MSTITYLLPLATLLFAALVLPFMGDVLTAAARQLRDDLPALPSLDLAWDTRVELARMQTLLHELTHDLPERVGMAIIDPPAHLVLDVADWALDRWAELTTPAEVSAPTSLLATCGVVPATCRDPAAGPDHWAMVDAARVVGTVWSDLPKVDAQPQQVQHHHLHPQDLPMRLARQARQRDVASGWFTT